MAGMDWFRWHHGSVTDPKFALVARKAGASVPDVLAVWCYILETASQSVERGDFGTVDCEALDCVFGFPATETRTADILKSMQDRDLTKGTRIASWEKRQPKREREDSTNADRQAAFRANKNQVTPDNASASQKTPRGEESRGEEKREVKGAERTARGTRLPENFEPDFEFAVNAGIQNTLEETSKFRDYWKSQPGSKGVKLDWQATWRNWCRNARPAARAGPNAARPKYAAAAAAIFDDEPTTQPETIDV